VLGDAAYRVEVVRIDHADHLAPIFQELEG